ncbi:MAG: tRNA (adenosine(37)-N6)-threonylcarbamoyltransferase complex dimerization subunit type 1 TsaB, partial [Oscillospiraceae bacterium]
MIILGIDTSAQTASAAVCSEDRIIACGSVNAKLTHSQTIMPLVTSLLEAAHISLDGIDAFAVSKGPGSFTGIRIGVSAVKGLAFAKSKPCIGVSTLSALAYNMLGFDGIICPVMDARCSQVYNAVFRISGGAPERLCPDRA